MSESQTAEYHEGVRAFSKNIREDDCPYDIQTQWDKWADWVAGYGAAQDIAWWDAVELEEARCAAKAEA